MITTQHTLVDITELSLKHCSSPIPVHLSYASPQNFTGKIVPGYKAEEIHIGLISQKAALQLCEIQEFLILNYGCILLIYDAYRPIQASQYFLEWCQHPELNELDKKNKRLYYPHVSKNKLIELGYVAVNPTMPLTDSVDVILADVVTKQPLDMGSPYNLFDPLSHKNTDIKQIGPDAKRYRSILDLVMQRFRFSSFENNYWRFQFRD